MIEVLITIITVFCLPLFVQLFDGPFHTLNLVVVRYFLMYGFIVAITYLYNLRRALRANRKCRDNVGLKKGLKVGIFCMIFMYLVYNTPYWKVPFTLFGPRFVDSLMLLTGYWLGYWTVSLQHGTC